MLADHVDPSNVQAPARRAGRCATGAQCRTCSTGTMRRLLDLGRAPVLTSELPPEGTAVATAPLRLARCDGCGVVQVEDALTPAARHLIATATLQRPFAGRPDCARRFCEDAIDRWRLRGDGHVIEVGSGTGSLLRFFRAWQLPVLGIEPDPHQARYAHLRNIQTWQATFDMAIARRIVASRKQADLLILETPTGAFAGMTQILAAAAEALRPGGMLTFQVPDVQRIVGHTRFDGLRHCDPAIPSIRQLQRMVAAHHLDVVDIERTPMADDRLRVWIRNRQENASAVGHPRLRTRMRAERADAVEDRDTVAAFVNRVRMARSQIRGLLDHAASERRTVAIWGTSPGAVAVACAVNAGHREVAYAVDPEGVGGPTVLPGTGIPILGPATAARRRPDLVLALDDLPQAPEGWEGVSRYAVTDLLSVVHRATDDLAAHIAR
jgi:hypothetical protein